MVARAGPRVRLLALVAVILVMGSLLAVTILPTGPTPTSRATVGPSGGPSPTPIPAAKIPPLTGATNDTPIPDCPPDQVPERAAAASPLQPVAGPVDLRVVGQLGGGAEAVLVDGTEVLVGTGAQVVLLDLADPRAPREAAISPALPGAVLGLARIGSLVVAATAEGGLAILDPADGLAVRGSVDLPGVAEGVAVVGTMAFVADGPGGLRIVDLSDPAAPVEVAALLDLHRIVAVAANGDRAYLAAADEGLFVVDVAKPVAPRVIASLFTGGYAFDVASQGTQVLLADGWAGLRVIDVREATAPALVASLPTAAWVMGVSIVEDRAYVAAGNEGLRVVDIVDPSNPRELERRAMPGGHATAVDAEAGLAVAIDVGSGVRVFDLAAGSPMETSVYAPLSTLNGIAISGDRVFLAAKGQGLRVVDVSDPEQPRERAGIRTEDLVWQVATTARNVFFGTVPRPESPWVGSIWGLDLAALDPPAPGPPLGGGGGPATAVDGSLMVTAAELNVWLLDGSGPTVCSLAIIETKKFLGEGFEANGVTIAGDYAYLAPFYDAIRIVDISDPRRPKLLEPSGNGGSVGVGKTFAAAGHLYAIGRDDRGPVMAVYSLADPLAPLLVGLVELPAETATSDQTGPQMAYGGGRLLVADEVGGLLAIDVSNPRKPAIAGRLRLPGDVVGVAVDDDHAYVASEGGGLFVIEWSPATTAREDSARSAGSADAHPSAAALDRSVAVRASLSIGPDAAGPASILGGAVLSGQCSVSVAADAGPGSLRACLEEATTGTRVTFDPVAFPPANPSTIRLEGPLPVISAPDVRIDATGAGVILNGGGSVEVGLELTSDDGALVGLQILDFNGFGVRVRGSRNMISDCVISGNAKAGITIAFAGPGNRIVGNLIGPDATGMRIHGRQAVGIDLGDETIVGGPDPGDRNVISGNQLEIFFKAVQDSVIEGNLIGTDIAGRRVLRAPDDGPGQGVGVWVGSTGNRIAGNVIAGGINILDPGSSYNVIVGNRVGVDATGTRDLGSGGGIFVEEPFNAVGGTLPGEGNIVSDAIVAGATDVIVVGNQVGVGPGGVALGAEPRIGIAKPRVVIGGRAPGGSNVVRGAVEITADGGLVIGNRIDARGRRAAVVVNDVAAGQIVANEIRGGEIGIHLRGGALGNTVRGNELRDVALAVSADSASERNLIVANAFLGDDARARDRGTANAWDDGRRGNYWSGFVGPDENGDGILDLERPVAPRGVDRLPLAAPP